MRQQELSLNLIGKDKAKEERHKEKVKAKEVKQSPQETMPIPTVRKLMLLAGPFVLALASMETSVFSVMIL